MSRSHTDTRVIDLDGGEEILYDEEGQEMNDEDGTLATDEELAQQEDEDAMNDETFGDDAGTGGKQTRIQLSLFLLIK